SREITSKDKILKKYVEREKIIGKNGSTRYGRGLRLTTEGRKLFDEKRLFHNNVRGNR
ncbi:MAG: hypothetical protein HRF40_13975, partial [Nitrososphaera sp.]